jgi:DNA anti-recombination protein RmuC
MTETNRKNLEQYINKIKEQDAKFNEELKKFHSSNSNKR